MTIRKAQSDDPAPKRRRARKSLRAAETTAGDEGEKVTEGSIRAARRFIQEYEIFRIYAAAARRAGEPLVRPRDYYCGCSPSLSDFLPVCEKKKPGCRFAGRVSPAEFDEDVDETLLVRFFARYRKALKARQKPTGPAKDRRFGRYLREEERGGVRCAPHRS